MLVKCPHCHTDFLVNEGEVKNPHGLVVDELVNCPSCFGVVTLIDTANSVEPKARVTPRPAGRWGSWLVRLIPARLRNLSDNEGMGAQIAALGTALAFLVILLYLQGVFGHLLPGLGKTTPNALSERDAAVTAAQSYVRNRLQTPRLATFPPLYDASVRDIGGNYLKVNSWVEERDSMGNRSRTSFVCTLKRLQQGNYSLDKLVIGSDNSRGE